MRHNSGFEPDPPSSDCKESIHIDNPKAAQDFTHNMNVPQVKQYCSVFMSFTLHQIYMIQSKYIM